MFGELSHPFSLMYQHPAIIVLLVILWLIMAACSNLPPCPENAGFMAHWGYAIAQFIGANLRTAFQFVFGRIFKTQQNVQQPK